MSDLGPPSELLGVLVRLRQALIDSALPLESGDVQIARHERQTLIEQLDDYVIPRFVQFEAPLLAVVGGSTGAGKSTLVNSLVGRRVSEPGVLRPTTRSPVLVHHPDDAYWFGADRLLPELERTDRATGDQRALQLVATTDLPAGLAILDAPDVDSVEEPSGTLAAQLLAAGDLWLFVTSAARYADQVPWDYLKEAAERSTAVAIVLDRTAPTALREVSSHLARMLTSRGLGDSPLFTVPESTLDEHGLLPPIAVGAIRTWLDGLAVDGEARSVVVHQTLDGAIHSLGQRSRVVSHALVQQEKLSAQLRADVEKAYGDRLGELDAATVDGTLLRGELLARWQEFVGTGDLMRGLGDKVRMRDRLFTASRGRPEPANELTVAVESGLETLIVEHAESAAERAALAWQSLPAGTGLLETAPSDIGRASRDLRSRTERAVRDWQEEVVDLVRTEGASRRAAFGVNGLAVALSIVVFTSTAGSTGAENGVVGASAIVGQKALEAAFGDHAVRRLVEVARKGLHERIDVLWADEQQRFLEVLELCSVPTGGAEQLTQLSREVDDVRVARAHA